MIINESISISRKPESIWNYWMDVSNDVYWRDGMTKAEWTSHPLYGIGSTGEHTHKDIGLMKWEAPCAKLCGETCKSSKSLWKIN